MALEYIWHEGYHRVVFFHEHGLLPVLPTREQVRAGCSSVRLAALLRKRGPFVRRLLSFDSFRRARVQASDPTKIKAGGTHDRYAAPGQHVDPALVPDGDDTAGSPLAERGALPGATSSLLARINEIDALRSVLIHCVVPSALLAGTGRKVGPSQLCNHLLLAPHPCEKAVWDLQLLQGDRGGFEMLEARVEEARRAQTLRGRTLRILGTRRLRAAHRFELVRTVDPVSGEVRYVDATLADGGEVVLSDADWNRWYDHMLETITRARRFQYALPRADDARRKYPAPTFVQFLRLCAQLEPRDVAFFRERSPIGVYPEIGWPRQPVPPC